MHEAYECDWSAETDGPQFEEIRGQGRQTNSGDLGGVGALHHFTSRCAAILVHLTLVRTTLVVENHRCQAGRNRRSRESLLTTREFVHITVVRFIFRSRD